MLKKKVFLVLSTAFFILFSAFNVQAQKYKVIMETSQGIIKMELFDETPKHRDNFVKLAKEGFYDELLFHRVIQGFMIQGGDQDSRDAEPGKRLGMGSLGYRVDAEFNPDLIHVRGALAAARDNNPEKASSSNQFYIVDGKKFNPEELQMLEQRRGVDYTEEQRKLYKEAGGAPHLDGEYTVYGRVIEGMEVVDKIAASEKDNFDRPKEDQKIIRVKIRKKFLFFYL